VPQPDLLSLVVVAGAAAAAPLVADLSGRLFIPTVVVEVFLGILIGPQVGHLAKDGVFIHFLSQLGLAFLFFLAGLEIDLNVIRGRPLRLATFGWLLSLVLGLTAAGLMSALGFFEWQAMTIVGITLATTAMGTLMPILRDAGVLGTRFGTAVVGVGVTGEFWPVIVISIFLTSTHRKGVSFALLALFLAVTLGAAVLAQRVHPPRLVRLVQATLHASGQLGVRLAILLLAALVYITSEFGFDFILGAFAAGLVVGLLVRGEGAQSGVRERLEGIGFGFLVPIFFIHSGMVFDANALVHEPATIAATPAFLVLFLLARGSSALLFKRALPRRDLLPLGFFAATALPLVVALTEIGVERGDLDRADAAAVLAAGMLSVKQLPLIGHRLLGDKPVAVAPEDQAEW
jgi:Kef-type K+ transport system membrane component KefB